MTNALVLEAIQREFPESVVTSSEPYGLLTIEIKKEDIKKVIHHMKTSSLKFIYLTDLCGIHYPEFPDRELGVIYHLHNLEDNVRVRLKVYMTREDGEVDSIVDLYSGANWMERETFDFYGVKFKGHPDLRVILNDPDLGYHPLLKEYRLEDGTREDKNDAMFGR